MSHLLTLNVQHLLLQSRLGHFNRLQPLRRQTGGVRDRHVDMVVRSDVAHVLYACPLLMSECFCTDFVQILSILMGMHLLGCLSTVTRMSKSPEQNLNLLNLQQMAWR